MKVGSTGTHLHLVYVEPGRLAEIPIATDIGAFMLWEGLTSSTSEQEVTEHGVHSFQWWSDNRAARIAMLRARVKSGTYKVNSTTIAESILSAKIHSG
ncbi:MAG TPA: flagellar biosynthesis anti-sigma factor FlgM [Ktedonobacteraceae bacterium]|jgi:Anti-sigma-28 factor, FlgM